jgi:hypothetical protein
MTDRERELLTEVARLRQLVEEKDALILELRVDSAALATDYNSLRIESFKEQASGRRLIAMLVRRIGQGEVVHFYDKDFLEIGDYELTASDEITVAGRAIVLRVRRKDA